MVHLALHMKKWMGDAWYMEWHLRKTARDLGVEDNAVMADPVTLDLGKFEEERAARLLQHTNDFTEVVEWHK